MNGASCAPAAGQRPVSQLTEMNRVGPRRSESSREPRLPLMIRLVRRAAFTAKNFWPRGKKSPGENNFQLR